MGSATVHVVDDDPVVLDSMRFLLETADYEVCTYDRPSTLLNASLGDEGCILTDFQMPELDGLALQERLAAKGLSLPVIVLTGHGDISSAVRAMKAGAVDFLEKPFEATQLLQAIARAIETNRRTLAHQRKSHGAAQQLAGLTVRELEVLEYVVAGRSSKEIAQTLGTSPRTVEVHRARIFQKCGAENLPQLVRLVLTARSAPEHEP